MLEDLQKNTKLTFRQKPLYKEMLVVKSIFVLSVLILVVFIAGQYDNTLGYLLTIFMLLYLMKICMFSPQTAFFIIIGIKFVFDGLWDIRMFGIESLKATHFFLIPLLLLTFSTISLKSGSVKLILLFCFYVSWTVLSSFINGDSLVIETYVRHAIPVFAIILASKYMRNVQNIDLLIYVIVIGSIIPLSAILVQYIFMINDVDILYSKYDYLRGHRISGLYYDAGTSGTISLMALVSSAYILLKKNFLFPKVDLIVYLVIFLSISSALLGETRSIVFLGAVIILLLSIVKIKKGWTVMLVLIPSLFIFQDNIRTITHKTSIDADFSDMQIGTVMKDKRSRTMLTGRVGIWQDVLYEYNKSSPLQKLLGTGKSMNTHSTYFYLLIKIGMLGLIFYLAMHFILIFKILKNRALGLTTKVSGVLSVLVLLGLGLSLNVVMFISYQIVLYLIIAAIIFMNNSEMKPLRA